MGTDNITFLEVIEWLGVCWITLRMTLGKEKEGPVFSMIRQNRGRDGHLQDHTGRHSIQSPEHVRRP